MKKSDLISKSIIVLFFLLIFVFGIFSIRRINGDFDEDIEQNIVLSNIKDYSEAFRIGELTQVLTNKGVNAISLDIERDHGVALYYVFTPLILIRDSIPHFLSILWHLYIYCIFFVSIICFYKLIKSLYKRLDLAIIMTSLYTFCPRIFIAGLHNNKDIAFMSLLVCCIYYLYKIIKDNKRKDMIVFSIISAFICNIKILGLFIVGIMGLFYVIYLILNKDINKKSITNVLLTIFLILFIYIIITPAIWGTGKFELISFIKYNFDNGVNFRAPISVLFEGTIYDKINKSLPWYYLPKMMLITLPIIISLLFIIGIIKVIINCIKKKRIDIKDYSNYITIISFVIFISIYLIYFITSPNIYNGWRHFYFLYGPMVIISCYGLNELIKHKKIINYVYVICIIFISYNAYLIAQYGPANIAYYNFLAGNKNLASTYELDYYSVTSKEALVNFMKSKNFKDNEDGKIYLTGFGFNNRILSDLYNRSSLTLKDKIVIIKDDELDSYKKKNVNIYNFSNPVYNHNDMSSYKLVYEYRMFKNNIVSFYLMND